MENHYLKWMFPYVPMKNFDLPTKNMIVHNYVELPEGCQIYSDINEVKDFLTGDLNVLTHIL
jgi:hypothetical protein